MRASAGVDADAVEQLGRPQPAVTALPLARRIVSLPLVAAAADVAAAVRARTRALPAAMGVVVAAWLVLAWPWLSGAEIIPWDSKLEFYPTLRFLAASWHEGQSALWNPYVYGGYPLLADPQSLMFSPLIAAAAWLVPAPSMHLADVLQLVHLLIGGCSVLLFFRVSRWSLFGGILAAIVYMFGASVSGRMQHLGMILSYSWLAVALLLLKVALDRASWRWAAAFGVIGAVLAANRDQVAMLGCATLLGYAGYCWLTAERPVAWLRSRLPALLVAGAVGATLLIVPLLLTLQFASVSNRPAIDLAEALTGSLSPVNFATMMVPDFFGSLGPHTDYWGPNHPRWPRGDWTDRSTNYLYFGLIPLVLLVWHGLLSQRLLAREARFLVLVAVVALLYTLGGHTPFYAWAYQTIPGVAEFRRPADGAFLLTFALALLSGYLFGRLVQDGSPGRIVRPVRLAAWLAAAVLLLAAVRLAAQYDEIPFVLPRLGVAALGLIVTILMLIGLGRAQRTRPLWISATLLLLVVDLRTYNVGTELNAVTPGDRQELARLDTDPLGPTLKRLVSESTSAQGPPRVEMLGLGGYWQKQSMVLDIENTQGYGPLRIGAYEDLTGIAQNSHENQRQFTGMMPGYDSSLGRLLGTRFIITTTDVTMVDKGAAHFPLLQTIGKARIYQHPEALPRVMFVRRGVITDSQWVVSTGRWPLVDPTSTVLLDEQGEDWNKWATRIDGSIHEPTVEIKQYANTEVRIDVATPLRGYVVLNDLHYPGWRAYLDGRPVDVLRANLLFRAVAVPPGRHQIVFRYEPFRFSNLLSALRQPD